MSDQLIGTFKPGDLVEWRHTSDGLSQEGQYGIVLEWLPPYVKTLEPLGGYLVYFSNAAADDVILHEELKLLSSN